MQIRGTVRFYRKNHPKKGSWEQVVIYIRGEDKDKLRSYDKKEITLYLSNGKQFDEKKETLLNALLDLFIAAYSKPELKAELNRFPEAKKVLSLLGGGTE